MRWIAMTMMAMALAGCGDPTAPAMPGHVEEFVLRDIPSDSLWWRWPCCGSLGGFPVDAEGVPTLNWQGQISYHPTYIAQNALVYADSYEKSKRPEFLNGLKLWTRALLQRSDSIDGAILARFDFPYSVHGNAAETLPVGWHSGFTQGMILSLMVRTAKITGDPMYVDAAHRVFRSLTQTDSRRVVHIDSAGYYWIDEYPLPQPDLTLNGFAYAVRGLYEYWQWQHSAEAEHYLRAAITSLKHYGPQYRVPGQSSVYCLAHRVPTPAYHGQVVQLFRDLARMSGDESFTQLADLFASDYAG